MADIDHIDYYLSTKRNKKIKEEIAKAHLNRDVYKSVSAKDINKMKVKKASQKFRDGTDAAHTGRQRERRRRGDIKNLINPMNKER